jgi:hypothetical protein
MIYHRDTESTERTLFLPDRETAIRQKDAALWAVFLGTTGSMPPVGRAPRELSPKAMALFPGRPSPGQGKHPCPLCLVYWLVMSTWNILVRSKGNNRYTNNGFGSSMELATSLGVLEFRKAQAEFLDIDPKLMRQLINLKILICAKWLFYLHLTSHWMRRFARCLRLSSRGGSSPEQTLPAQILINIRLMDTITTAAYLPMHLLFR